MSRLIEDYIRELFDEKKISEENREKLWKYYYDKLSKGVDVGWNQNFKIDDKDLVTSLKQSIAEFSAFKETAFRKELEELLVKDGKLMPWSEFKKEALKISGDYNARWLEAEYHQTIANANAAAQWKSFQHNAELYPNLKLVSVRDARVRPEHKALDGTIRPLNDSFWHNHLPPLDWGCRCYVEQTDEEPTEIKGGLQMKIEFENNPGKTGKIFGGSAYMIAGGLNPDEKTGNWGRKMFEKYRRYSNNYASYLKYKTKPDYFDVTFDKEKGGMKAIHRLHNFDKNTGKYEKEILEMFYKKGDKIILTNEDPKIKGKKVDGLLNNLSFDISSIQGEGKNTIKRALNHSREKNAEIAILYFPNPESFSIDRLIEGINKYNGQTKYRFKKIIYIVNNKINHY